MSPIVVTALCSLVSFAICGIPFGLIVARTQGIDVRKEGSGNIGMTNVARTVGGKAAAALEHERSLLNAAADKPLVGDTIQHGNATYSVASVATIAGVAWKLAVQEVAG